MCRKLLFLASILATLNSCSPSKMKVDLIVTNASVYTVDSSFSKAGSFAVKDGKFIAIGAQEEILSKYSSNQILDCSGKPIYPGFIDAHCHFYGYGMDLMQYVTLDGSPNQESIYNKLKEYHQKLEGNWILGRGWDQKIGRAHV